MRCSDSGFGWWCLGVIAYILVTSASSMQLYDIVRDRISISFVFDERRPQASVASQLSICCTFYEKLDLFFKCKRCFISNLSYTCFVASTSISDALTSQHRHTHRTQAVFGWCINMTLQEERRASSPRRRRRREGRFVVHGSIFSRSFLPCSNPLISLFITAIIGWNIHDAYNRRIRACWENWHIPCCKQRPRCPYRAHQM